MIVPYINSIRQHHTGGTTINNDVSLTCMTMIDPATGWFKMVKFPIFGLDEVAAGNDE